jgi:hypothetical protein
MYIVIVSAISYTGKLWRRLWSFYGYDFPGKKRRGRGGSYDYKNIIIIYCTVNQAMKLTLKIYF